MKQDRTISLEDQRIINCILSTRSIVAAAKCAKIGRSKIYRRLDDPTFQAALQEAQAQLLDKCVEELQKLSLAATNALWSVFEDDLAETKDKLRAANTVLTHVYRLTEQKDVLTRLAVIEELLKQ